MSYIAHADHLSVTAGESHGPVRSLLSSFRWALEMNRRCNREIAMGRRLDDEAIRRIAQQIADERPDLA